ncbi:MAG: cyclase family protein [Desulfohalobiaceae bacterium]|nr:cyclase family protein [Desulfohalobiaceae bacterium]
MTELDWIDISVPLHTGMVHWPGDPEFCISRQSDIQNGDPATVSRLCLGAHSGTHMDAPAYFFPNAAGIEAMPLETTIGPARVVAIEDPAAVRPEELEQHSIQYGERILFKTRNSGRVWKKKEFVQDYVSISKEAAEYLAQLRLRCVGIDYLSVGGYDHDGADTHLALLRARVWIIEGLDLSSVQPGDYDLICLPLSIVGADGAPARAIIRPAAPTTSPL